MRCVLPLLLCLAACGAAPDEADPTAESELSQAVQTKMITVIGASKSEVFANISGGSSPALATASPRLKFANA
jgi:hypothetical protein